LELNETVMGDLGKHGGLEEWLLPLWWCKLELVVLKWWCGD
jgi:hypothetical protein